MSPALTVPVLSDRASGVLLHPTSLPNDYPIGDLGPSAYAFVDFLAESGQRWWQMLPFGPPGPGHSPYQAYSAFAGNPQLISPDLLVREGFLVPSDIKPIQGAASHVDYEAAHLYKRSLLMTAFEKFLQKAGASKGQSFREFCRRQKAWLDDFALFLALRRTSGESWNRWPKDLRSRNPRALNVARRYLGREVRYHQFVQWIFALQWNALRHHCAERGIGLIGDIPIFVALNSADVWAHRDIFKLGPDGSPLVVAGVPPDYFSKTGQLWGNPHYRWDILKKQNYQWWIERIRQTLSFCDAVRLDHFIGFVRGFEIPREAKTAEKGRFEAGPGDKLFKAVKARLGQVPFIAEDLGLVTKAVVALRDEFDFPGMRVLQFDFQEDTKSESDAPCPKRCVVYTGTHDNNTTVGWFQALRPEERATILKTLQGDGKEIHWDLIRMALESPADTAIIPMQDLLGLESEARMNVPGTPEGNWAWRLKEGQLTSSLAKRLRDLTKASGRTA